MLIRRQSNLKILKSNKHWVKLGQTGSLTKSIEDAPNPSGGFLPSLHVSGFRYGLVII